VQRHGLGFVPGVPAKFFTVWMNDWEPGVMIAGGSGVPDCVWVARDRSGKPVGVTSLTFGVGRAPTLTCPMYSAVSSVMSCSAVALLLVLADTATALCDRTTGRVRRAIVRTAGMILGSLCLSKKLLRVDNFQIEVTVCN